MVYAWAEWRDHIQHLLGAGDGRVSRACDIPLPGVSMVHGMSLTGRYAIVYDQPVTVSLTRAVMSRFPFRWDPD